MNLNNGKIQLKTTEQLKNCMQSGVNVEAWVFDSFDKVGCVSKFDDDVVVIDGEYFVREHCRFYI